MTSAQPGLFSSCLYICLSYKEFLDTVMDVSSFCIVDGVCVYVRYRCGAACGKAPLRGGGADLPHN